MKKIAIVLFWIFSLTWGLPATLAGSILSLVCLARGLKPRLFHGNICFEHVRPYGSNNLGPFFFLGDRHLGITPYHEAGHGLQNIVLGPLYPLVVGISSEIWFRHFNRKYAEQIGVWPPEEHVAAYDKMPIERWATSWGLKAYGPVEKQ